MLGDPRLPPRFWKKVLVCPARGCWLWLAALDTSGYATFGAKIDGRFRTRSGHRVSFEALVGPAPVGLHLDHLCRVRRCVNPAHLEPVTGAVNSQRGETGHALAASQRAKTHCPKGHGYTGKNLGIVQGVHRRCLECHRIRESARYAAKAGTQRSA